MNERAEFPQRANIYADDGRPLAQQDALIYSLYVIQQDMPNVDDCLNTLALVTRQHLNTLRRIFVDYLAETLFHIAEIDSDQYETHQQALAADCDIRITDGPPQQSARVSIAQLLRARHGHPCCRLYRRGAG